MALANTNTNPILKEGTGITFTVTDQVIEIAASGSGTTLASGTYTPTLTNVTNITSASVVGFQYMRVGSVVTVSGVISINTTGAGASELGISLVVSSNIGSTGDLAGTAHNGAVGGYVNGDATNNRGSMQWSSSGAGTTVWMVHFTYLII